MRFYSLKWLLFIFYILFGCLPFIGVSYITTTNAGSFVSTMAQEQMEERSRLLAMQMNDRIYRQQRELQLLARLSKDSTFKPAALESYLKQMAGEDLFALQQTTWHPGKAPTDEDSSLSIKKMGSSYNLHFYARLPDQQGYIERKISLAFILAPLYSSMGEDIATYVLKSPDGKILWLSNGEKVSEYTNQQNVKEATYPVSRLGVLLQILVPESFLFDDLNNQAKKNLLFAGAISVLATMAAFAASAVVSNKLAHIINGTTQLAQGNFDCRLPKQRLYEMMLLTEMVNSMGEQLKNHKERVVQAEKLSLLGMFSAEVAHELKNPLAGMKASAQLLSSMSDKMAGQIDNMETIPETAGKVGDSRETTETEKFRIRLNHTKSIAKGINSEIDRLTEILQELLLFAKPSPPKKQETTVASMVESAIKSLYAQLQKNNISIAVSIDYTTTYVDALQILQVLLNLLTNAVNAVLKNRGEPNHNQGASVSSDSPQAATNYDTRWPPKTYSLKVDGRHYAIYGPERSEEKKSNDYIWITGIRGKNSDYSLTIKDNGGGIAPQYLKRIFDPFFTIDSKGHGLGLSIAQSLCHQNNVDLDVKSSLEQGTTFVLHFFQLQKD